ncbi:MAG TPA: outer membrane beta-barrel protein [Opitutus sp.]|nr:outer membrane beta-barrel protein [Opitutus sp.]
MKIAAALALAASLPALAEIKLNDTLAVSGYIEGSYQYHNTSPGGTSDSFNIDSSQLLFTAKMKPVTGVLSMYYVPNANPETTVLDAYATYDAGDGLTITGGKFLSYLGYESFFTVNNPEITFANGDFLGVIPGYHEGIKADYSGEGFGLGAALVDSVYSPYGATKGDGELQHNGGMETYVSYTGTPGLTVWAGLAYDSKGNFEAHSVVSLDFWAQYQLTKAAALGAEYAHKDGGLGASGYNWLAMLNYSFTDKLSTAFRISGESMDDGGPSFTRFTIAPGVAVTPNLTVRAEYTYTDYSHYTADSASFVGVQAFFKF